MSKEHPTKPLYSKKAKRIKVNVSNEFGKSKW